MKLHQRIDIDNLDTIIPKIKTYLERKNLIKTSYVGYILLNKTDIILYCPELFQSFLKLGLSISTVAIYRTTNNTQSEVHIDNTPYQCRINIPIMNCENTSTVFYTATNDEMEEQDYNNLTFVKCKDPVEIDRVTIDRPTILRVNAPHRVIMDETRSPRICLTVRCEPDPEILLTD